MMLRYKILIKKEEVKVNIEIQYNQQNKQKLASFHSQRSKIPIVRLKTCQYLFTAKFYRLRANFCSRRKISL